MDKVRLKEKKRSKLTSLSFLGTVELSVKDLEQMKSFYQHIIGLDIMNETKSSVTLGKNKLPLVTLHKKEQLSSSHPTAAGLYHFAIVFSSRGDLARTINRILKQAPQFFSGSGDHLVSEAFYFSDPEGNGIELYYDRDRSTWQWENNHIKMATLYIDPVEYINRYIVLEEKDTKTKMGHIHLKVGDIEKAEQFYVNILGFNITAELPGALFVSVGGYHHHIGMNTWESYGAEERKESLGLKQFTFILSDRYDFENLRNRLAQYAVNFHEEKNSLTLLDPWNNQIKLVLGKMV